MKKRCSLKGSKIVISAYIGGSNFYFRFTNYYAFMHLTVKHESTSVKKSQP